MFVTPFGFLSMRLVTAVFAVLLLLPWSAVSANDEAQAILDMIATEGRASNSDAVVIMRGDEVLLSEASADGSGPIELMSVTKSVVALAVGALLQDGKLQSLDTPVHFWFPEWKQGRKKQITLRMLMAHTSGLQNESNAGLEIYPSLDVVQLALAAELSDDPGARYSYNNKATNLLSAIIASAAGERMDEYVRKRLLKPLGIRSGAWSTDASGNPYAMAGLAMSAHDAARIGRLVLDRGRFGGNQVVPAEFIDEMLAPTPKSDDVGLLWFRQPASVRFHVDEASLELLQRVAAPDLVEALRPLLGERFDGADELYSALAQQLGPSWLDRWRAELIAPHGIGPWKPFHPQEGPVEAFRADGYLGQYIVVIPKAKLVGVRQIISRDGHAPHHNYSAFPKHVQALADALVPGGESTARAKH